MKENQSTKQQYLAKTFKEWDKKTPLVLFGTDEYFFHENDILIHIQDSENPNELEFMICEPNYAGEIDFEDLFCDILPEDMHIDEMHPELYKAMEKVNEIIRREDCPLSWTEGEFRTSIKESDLL
jgi:hypothetical protein